MATLPSLTRTINDLFVTTWYAIQKQATDNILDATPVMALLKARGRMKSQVGELFINRKVKYAYPEAQAIAKGSTLDVGETESETMARWNWKWLAIPVQRSPFDDQMNSGAGKIKSLVEMELANARDGLSQRLEQNLFRVRSDYDDGEAGLNPHSLFDIVPAPASKATGTYGQIARTNTSNSKSWWQPRYNTVSAPVAVNLLTEMRTLFNDCTNNQETPNLILTTQEWFETYEEFAEDKGQIVLSERSTLANLGFTTLLYKGKEMVWTDDMPDNRMLMLNTDYIDLVYDPRYWMTASDWHPYPTQLEQVMHILCCYNVISWQLRRHGSLDLA